MTKRLTTLAGAASLVAATLAITVAAPAAHAGIGPGEDRQKSTPTAWWAYANRTAAQVSSSLTANSARLTDIKIKYVGASPRFTVTEVANTGAYATGWYWYYGLSPASLVTKALNNSARITSMHCTIVSSNQRCAAIMIKNTGANAEAWSAWVGTSALIASKITKKNRMVSLSRIQGTTKYVAVFGSNTGTNATSWWWFYGKTATGIVNYALAHHARVVDLDRNATGTYNAVLYANPAGTPWYAYTGMTAAGIVNKATQLGQRLLDLTPYIVAGHTYYAGVMVNNSNSLTSKLIATFTSKVPNGRWGFEFKKVGGAVLAGLQTTSAFEPASALKVLYHYRVALSEQQGSVDDASPVAYRYDSSDPTNKDICPDNFDSVQATTLANADTLMMTQSDNRMTRGIVEKFGKPAMVGQAAALGMTHTVIKHNIGCPTASTHNRTSLSDLAKLYSAVSQETALTGTWNATFRNRMLNQTNYPSAKASICSIVNQEAASLGKSQATAKAFCAQVRWIAKGGSYQYGGSVTSPISWANGSVTSIPVRSGQAVTLVDYFYGDYFDQVSFASAAKKSALAAARSTAFHQALRPTIRAALATW